MCDAQEKDVPVEVSATLERLCVRIWELSGGWSGEGEQRARTSSDVLTFKVQGAKQSSQWRGRRPGAQGVTAWER